MPDTTSHFDFYKLSGTDQAGYNSINSLITRIDTQVYARIAVPGMVILWDTSSGSVPTGWTDVTSTLVASGAPSITNYKYIKKAV